MTSSPTPTEPLARVTLAISAYRSDEAILERLAALFAQGNLFGAVIVVDSLGSGKIAETIARAGWPVLYHNADTNLGSAGNLATRLSLAAESGLDWCLALNHDGAIDVAAARALVAIGEADAKVGAVYPTLRFTAADNRLDRPRTSFLAFSLLENQPDADAGPTSEVLWSSSNGALYRLDPFREGARAWPELWMGYEDLAIGWELHQRGWKQLLARAVTVDDNYEYRRRRLLGRTMHLADKPVWYSYYQSRNLAALLRRTDGQAVSGGALALRFATDVALVLLFRPRKLRRLTLLARGLRDGLRGQLGKGAVP